MECTNILCDKNPPIQNKKDFLKWSLTNHPDKNVQTNKDIVTKNFQAVSTCVDELLSDNKTIDCELSESIIPSIRKPIKKISKKKASCTRKIENWTIRQLEN